MQRVIPECDDVPPGTRHAFWVKITHWLGTLSFLALAFSGFVILMCHPRLYWGEVGNGLTPALFELPISRNHQHGGWEEGVPFYEGEASPVSAIRAYEILNENGWGRSLHFLGAWFLVMTGVVYLVTGMFTGHFRRHLLPRSGELATESFRRDLMDHLRLQIPLATSGPQYGLLQKCAYLSVIFVMFPLSIVTGLAMSPAITAAYPFLSGMFGGFQSARTIHFFASIVLVLFLFVHVLMIIKSGFKRQIGAMTFER